MTEHLPECLALLNDSTWEGDCICAALRACEQRCDEKRHAEVRAWSELSRDNFDHGFAAGLDAAREAVAALPEYRMRDTCVSAIDELREEKK